METLKQDNIDCILDFIANNLRFFHYNPKCILNYTLENKNQVYTLSMTFNSSLNKYIISDVVLYKKRKTWYGRMYYEYCFTVPIERIFECENLNKACAEFTIQKNKLKEELELLQLNLGIAKFLKND